MTVEQGDSAYASALAGKPYIAPASAWFSTHYGPEVSYSKNWVFPSDALWYTRWNEILTLGPRFVEIITWNDYGESHYIGPLSSKHTDDGSSKWVNDMLVILYFKISPTNDTRPHDGWLDMVKPFIAAYKAGATSVDNYITNDQIVYWYRQNLKSLDCSATDTCEVPAPNASGNYFEGVPNGWQDMQDSVFVVSLLKEAGQLTVHSGSNSQAFNVPAGASLNEVAMGLGQQSFILSRNGAAVSGLSGASLKDITGVCNCGSKLPQSPCPQIKSNYASLQLQRLRWRPPLRRSRPARRRRHHIPAYRSTCLYLRRHRLAAYCCALHHSNWWPHRHCTSRQ